MTDPAIASVGAQFRKRFTAGPSGTCGGGGLLLSPLHAAIVGHKCGFGSGYITQALNDWVVFLLIKAGAAAPNSACAVRRSP